MRTRSDRAFGMLIQLQAGRLLYVSRHLVPYDNCDSEEEVTLPDDDFAFCLQSMFEELGENTTQAE